MWGGGRGGGAIKYILLPLGLCWGCVYRVSKSQEEIAHIYY